MGSWPDPTRSRSRARHRDYWGRPRTGRRLRDRRDRGRLGPGQRTEIAAPEVAAPRSPRPDRRGPGRRARDRLGPISAAKIATPEVAPTRVERQGSDGEVARAVGNEQGAGAPACSGLSQDQLRPVIGTGEYVRRSVEFFDVRPLKLTSSENADVSSTPFAFQSIGVAAVLLSMRAVGTSVAGSGEPSQCVPPRVRISRGSCRRAAHTSRYGTAGVLAHHRRAGFHRRRLEHPR